MRRMIPLAILLLLGLTSCGEDDPVAVPDQEDDPGALTLDRPAWTLPSPPAHGRDDTTGDAVFSHENRVRTVRWFQPRDPVLWRHLAPDLTGPARDRVQPALDMFLRADDGTWDADDWGGIMCGIDTTGMDIPGARILDIWVNDFQVDPTLRRGRLHIDFGLISEDGYWPLVWDWDYGEITEYGTMQNEDRIFTQDEDTGLGGITDAELFSPFYVSDANPYPDINSTTKNNEWDVEDPDGDRSFNLDDEYFSTVIDLRDTPAVVDVLRDHGDSPDIPVLVEGGHAWRMYRFSVDDLTAVTATGRMPDLDRVRHLRIWFEDEGRPDDRVWLQITGLRFRSGS